MRADTTLRHSNRLTKRSLSVPQLQLPVTESMVTSRTPGESANNGLTLAMTIAAIVLIAAYFAVSVLAVSR